jgi:bifunctional non-homologous end joining protein LigD
VDLRSIELMLATNHPPFSRPGWVFEFKYDGYRVLANKEQLLTRNKKDASTWYPEILQALQKLRGSFILDGEVCLLDENGIPNFEAMRGRAVRKRGEFVTYFAFDLLFLNGRDLRPLPLLERKARLRKLIRRDTPRLRYVDHIATQGELMFKHAVSIGLEGVVGKRADSQYKGGRSKDWLKSKPVGYHDGWERRREGLKTCRQTARSFISAGRLNLGPCSSMREITSCK